MAQNTMNKNSGKDNEQGIIALNSGHVAEGIILSVNSGAASFWAKSFLFEHFDAVGSLAIDVVFYSVLVVIAVRRKIEKKLPGQLLRS